MDLEQKQQKDRFVKKTLLLLASGTLLLSAATGEQIQQAISKHIAIVSKADAPRVIIGECRAAFSGSKSGFCNSLILPPKGSKDEISPALHQFIITSRNTITASSFAIGVEDNKSIASFACGENKGEVLYDNELNFSDLNGWKKSQVSCNKDDAAPIAVFHGEGIAALKIIDVVNDKNTDQEEKVK